MEHFTRPDDARLLSLAERYGTPLWVYDAAVLDRNLAAWRDALSGLGADICYAVKANGNLALLQRLARAGCGFDVVSGGELARVLRAGGDASRTVFSGVGKRADEIDAALAAGVGGINVESGAELELVSTRAVAAGKTAPVSLRINPGVDAGTHRHIATGDHDDKFGIPLDRAAAVARVAHRLDGVSLEGLAVHIGSQLTDLSPVELALQRVLELHDALSAEGIVLKRLDAGGGLGIRYIDETPPSLDEYARTLERALDGRALELTVEPGRALIGEAGVLLTRVAWIKPGMHHAFAVCDAGMSELLRPALYDAAHPVAVIGTRRGEPQDCELVGPLCESGDVLARRRRLAVTAGDLVAVGCCGAYGASMSTRYNARPLASEVLLDGDEAHLIRRREDHEDLWRHETLLP